MSLLPYEVLALTLGYLEPGELLGCQLTSKQWYKASLPRLHATKYIVSERIAALYIRAVTNSPHLGKYLDNIILYCLYEKNGERIIPVLQDLLDAVIQYCPNVTKITWMDKEEFPLWTQLMHAASRGQLTYLKSLPKCSCTSSGSYIYTALSFKNSLVSLFIRDECLSFGPQLARLGAYRRLCDQMDQFEKLETLYLNYVSDKYLSYFDGLIDKCHHLKEVNFDLTVKDVQQPPNDEPPESKIRPRPDIRKFECNWRLIDVESQLEYVMHKFPNLETLSVTDEDEVVNCSGPILVKFIRYIMLVSDFEIYMNIKEEDLLAIWTEFRKGKNGSKKLFIAYSSSNSWSIGISADSGIALRFPIFANDDEPPPPPPPHILFFSRAGETIQSITIDASDGILSLNGEKSTSVEWLFDILGYCRILEEITMNNMSYTWPSRNTLKYPSLKRLNIDVFYYTNSYNFLSCLSLNLPNLNQLSFKLYAVKKNYTEPITIHMPHTSLDLLTWNEEKSYGIEDFKGTEVYIKLKTCTGTKFYVGIRNSLFEIESDRYLCFSKHTRFDIDCKHLKELRVRRSVAPESDANLIF